MRLFAAGSLAILLVAGCGPEKKKETIEERLAEPEVEKPVSEGASNVLTAQQKADGWKLLFDGKSLSGWHFYQKKPNNSWEIRESALHCKPFLDDVKNERSDLVSNDEFENYELSWDWKAAPQTNSGVIYRTSEAYGEPYLSGPEYQMLDEVGASGTLNDWQRSGACFGLYAPVKMKPRPVGEWNSSRLVIKNNHVEHWLNGVNVLSYDFDSPAWKKTVAASKWKDEKAYGVSPKGYIDLQDHGSEVWFKNIAIRLLN